jgi:hypothetical protein
MERRVLKLDRHPGLAEVTWGAGEKHQLWLICSITQGMVDAELVPAASVVTTKGDGSPVDITGAATRVFLLELDIRGVVEQESLTVSILGGEAGTEQTRLASFPQHFYVGRYPLLLDLSALPAITVLRAHWEVNRWGRGPQTPWFKFGLRLREVPDEILQDLNRKPAGREL